MYLPQISLTGGIPFAIALLKAPASIDADAVTTDQLRAELQAGYEDMVKDIVQNAAIAFEGFRSRHP